MYFFAGQAFAAQFMKFVSESAQVWSALSAP
jgi:hypothetical protein